MRAILRRRAGSTQDGTVPSKKHTNSSGRAMRRKDQPDDEKEMGRARIISPPPKIPPKMEGLVGSVEHPDSKNSEQKQDFATTALKEAEAEEVIAAKKSSTIGTLDKKIWEPDQPDMLDRVFNRVEAMTCREGPEIIAPSTIPAAPSGVAEPTSDLMGQMFEGMKSLVCRDGKEDHARIVEPKRDLMDQVFEGMKSFVCRDDKEDNARVMEPKRDLMDQAFEGMESIVCRDGKEGNARVVEPKRDLMDQVFEGMESSIVCRDAKDNVVGRRLEPATTRNAVPGAEKSGKTTTNAVPAGIEKSGKDLLDFVFEGTHYAVCQEDLNQVTFNRGMIEQKDLLDELFLGVDPAVCRDDGNANDSALEENRIGAETSNAEKEETIFVWDKGTKPTKIRYVRPSPENEQLVSKTPRTKSKRSILKNGISPALDDRDEPQPPPRGEVSWKHQKRAQAYRRYVVAP
jgi:hypothetical protein